MLIGIAGKKQSGKDEVARMIRYLYWKKLVTDKGTLKDEQLVEYPLFTNFALDGNNVQNKKFADKLKDMVCLLLNCSRELLEKEEFKNTPLGEEWWYYKFQDRVVTLPDFEELHKHQKEWLTLVKPTPRTFLQLLGTECGRKIIHPNIWVNATMNDYLPNNPIFEKPNWVISDVRFPNEVKVIKDFDGLNIRVERLSGDRHCTCGLSELEHLYEKEGTVYSKYRHFFVQVEEEHESETALDKYEDWDYVIHNNGTIEELLEKVTNILKEQKII